jgi:hypothetical protein
LFVKTCAVFNADRSAFNYVVYQTVALVSKDTNADRSSIFKLTPCNIGAAGSGVDSKTISSAAGITPFKQIVFTIYIITLLSH